MMTQYQPFARALIIAVVEVGKLVDYYALGISTASREARDFPTPHGALPRKTSRFFRALDAFDKLHPPLPHLATLRKPRANNDC